MSYIRRTKHKEYKETEKYNTLYAYIHIYIYIKDKTNILRPLYGWQVIVIVMTVRAVKTKRAVDH